MATTEVVKSEEAKVEVETNGNADTADTKSKTETVESELELTPELSKAIVKQIEYYFGDINLSRDKFLKEQIALEDGWVPLTVLLTFNRLVQICPDAEVIIKALKSDSTLMQVNEDLKKVRRDPEKPVPEFTEEYKQELMKRTAYAKGFPADETLENIMKFMEPYGPCDNINMRHYTDKATSKAHFKGSIFAVFKEIELCKKFIETEDMKYKEIELIRKWQADWLQEKKQEREERIVKRKKDPKPEQKKYNFPNGAILHMKGMGENVTREVIKSRITEIGEVEPAFITYVKGQPEGLVRFPEENNAVDFVKKLTDGKMDLLESSVEVRALEGEEEEKFLSELSIKMIEIRTQNKSGRGRKRKGHGDGGPRSKQGKK